MCFLFLEGNEKEQIEEQSISFLDDHSLGEPQPPEWLRINTPHKKKKKQGSSKTMLINQNK